MALETWSRLNRMKDERVKFVKILSEARKSDFNVSRCIKITWLLLFYCLPTAGSVVEMSCSNVI